MDSHFSEIDVDAKQSMNNTMLFNTSFGDEPTVCKIYAKEFLPATVCREANNSLEKALSPFKGHL